MICYERVRRLLMSMVSNVQEIPFDEIVFRSHVGHYAFECPHFTVVGEVEHAKLVPVLIPAGVHLEGRMRREGV